MRYGEFIWENVYPDAADRAFRMPGFLDDLEALRFIFQTNERAMFDVVVSDRAIVEVSQKLDRPYLHWVLDVAAHWRERTREYRGCAFAGTGVVLAHRLDDSQFGYLSVKDKELLREALMAECSVFITMEKKLPRAADHFEAATGMRLLRPPAFVDLLMPWAGLFR